MSKVFYTSDLHLGHRLVSKIRGFDNTDDHDQAIAAHWAVTVRKDDIVYVLGDLSINNPTYAINFLTGLPGRKRLVFGNHDFGAPHKRDAPRWTTLYSKAFEWSGPYGRRRINGRNVLLSHYPYHTDRDPNVIRELQWRLPDMGEYLLHGHLHSNEIWTSKREIHVGWDTWQRLVDEQEIAAMVPALTTSP